MNNYLLLQGNSLERLRELPDEYVSCVITSPPYYGLRDYGVDGQLGRETSPQEYISNLVKVFREVRRVLKANGTLWINIGDTYAANRAYQVAGTISAKRGIAQAKSGASKVPSDMKPKDLIGIPWMLAFALRNDGWYLRQDIIWHKPNAIPESVKDRCTKAHEYIFMLSKNSKYHYDYMAVKEKSVSTHASGNGFKREARESYKNSDGSARGSDEQWKPTELRNRRSVWSINTKPFKEAHFAVFPEALVEPCLLAGCPEGEIVLDPFSGSATTGVVALKNNRSYIGIELNSDYNLMASRRLGDIYKQAG